MDEDNIDTINSLTGAKYSRAQINDALCKVEGDIDDAIQYLLDLEKPAKMFSNEVVSRLPTTKMKVDQQKQNSKFGGIYSKAKPQKWGNTSKPSKLAEAENKLHSDYFSQLMMLQNREVGDNDLADLLEEKKETPLDDKISVAKDIFANSSSREYLINLQRINQGKLGQQ